MYDERLQQLTEVEKETLRLLLRHSEIKTVARMLARSVPTVEQRLSRARRKLAVPRSMDAAHILAEAETGVLHGSPSYAPSISVPEDAAAPSHESSETGPPDWLPFPTKGRPWNMLSTRVRLVWIAAGAVAVTVTSMLLINLVETASRIAR